MPYLPPPRSIWIILVPIFLFTVLSLCLLLFALGQKPPDDAWKGIFYSNRGDSANFVPKRYGIGYTLNFGNPWSWVVLIFGTVMALLLRSVSLTHHLPR